MNNLERLYKACRRFPCRHGHGIHSPFAFDLITSVLYGRYHYYAYEELCKARGRIPGNLPRYPKRVDEMLFRLVNRFQPKLVVEVGTGSGLSIRYMAAAKRNARYMAMGGEHDEAVAALLKEAGVEYRHSADKALIADFKDWMRNISSVDLLHIAHTPMYEAVFEETLKHVSSRSLVIVEGIYESKARQAWWKRVVADSRTRVTFDLYEIGLVFFDTSRPKQHYIA